MNPTLIPFKAEHLLSFVDKNTDILQEMRHAVEKERRGPAFTAIVDGRVIGCGGVMVMWPGVGAAWVSVDKDITRYGIWLTRNVKAALRDIVKGLGLHRVEAVALSHSRWLKIVGFHKETDIAQAYTQDKLDVVRYAFIVGETK